MKIEWASAAKYWGQPTLLTVLGPRGGYTCGSYREVM